MEGNFRVADDRGLGKALLHSVFIEFKRNRPVNPPLSLPTTSPDFRA